MAAGIVRVTVGDETVELSAGDSCNCRIDAQHGIENPDPSAQALIYLIIERSFVPFRAFENPYVDAPQLGHVGGQAGRPHGYVADRLWEMRLPAIERGPELHPSRLRAARNM